ncbi:NAD(P)/FAD-dependent oxidoreductase [Streptomyces sp. NPDC059564]|uniref:NAD(P)/FAD-dependent oxidoreductase n=1 Tax=Streptomyces sp. NPDC059564 TaxID=3346865 RepID=UPI0036BADED9
MNAHSPGSPHQSVVIGAGMAGILAAAVLAKHGSEVTVIERDVLPAGPGPRKCLPQARHVHVLWSGGVAAFEAILPGITNEWVDAGARRISLPTDLVTMTARGWIPRWPEMKFNIACSRDLLDWVVRRRVMMQHPGITVLERHVVEGFSGDARQLTGVQIRGPEAGTRTLHADLVIDTSGRGSRSVQWLGDLGIPEVKMMEVDSGLVYASRLFEAPRDRAGEPVENLPIVNVQSNPSDFVPGRTATIVPIEGGRILGTLSGTYHGQPTGDPEDFVAFAKSIRHPVVGDLMEALTPLDDQVMVTRSTLNRRRLFEKARVPRGFLAVGDSVATFNPLYGQGMTVAAQGLVALDALIGKHGLTDPVLTRLAQKAVGRRAAVAYELASSQDILYPGAVGRNPRPGSGLVSWYANRVMATASTQASAAQAFLDVITMTKMPTAWLRPKTLFMVLRGPQAGAAPTGPPITEEEQRIFKRTASLTR